MRVTSTWNTLTQRLHVMICHSPRQYHSQGNLLARDTNFHFGSLAVTATCTEPDGRESLKNSKKHKFAVSKKFLFSVSVFGIT